MYWYSEPLHSNDCAIPAVDTQFQIEAGRRVIHIMMTSSNGNIFALLAICTGKSPVTGEFPAQRPVARSFDIFFDLRLIKGGGVNKCEAGDLRLPHAHYDVNVMLFQYAIERMFIK